VGVARDETPILRLARPWQKPENQTRDQALEGAAFRKTFSTHRKGPFFCRFIKR